MLISEILFEDYKTAKTKFQKQGIEPSAIDQVFAQYKELVNKNQVQGNERNIDWWAANKSWEEFNQFVADKSEEPTNKQIKSKKAVGNSIMLEDNWEWLIVIPLDHNASCFHGKDTDWCTSKPQSHFFDEYFLDLKSIMIYCINKLSGEKWAIKYSTHKPSGEILPINHSYFDQDDHLITDDEFERQTGLKINEILDLIPDNDPRIVQARDNRLKARKKVMKMFTIWDRQGEGDHQRNKEIENFLVKHTFTDFCSGYVWRVASKHGKQKFPSQIARAAVMTSERNIEAILDPPSSLQVIAVKGDPFLIGQIDNPSEAAQIAAVTEDPKVFDMIKNPYPSVIQHHSLITKFGTSQTSR